MIFKPFIYLFDKITILFNYLVGIKDEKIFDDEPIMLKLFYYFFPIFKFYPFENEFHKMIFNLTGYHK